MVLAGISGGVEAAGGSILCSVEALAGGLELRKLQCVMLLLLSGGDGQPGGFHAGSIVLLNQSPENARPQW